MSSKVLNMTLFDSGEKIYWTEVREVTVTSNDPVAILINTRFGCNPNRIDLFRNNRTRRSAENQSSDIELLFNLPKPGVSKDKKNDLLYLCTTKQIPSAYHKYFDSL